MSARHALAALLALVLATIARADDMADFERAMEKGDFDAAVVLAERMAEQHAQSSVAAYNAACAHARAGHADAAIGWLEKSAALGFAGVRSIRDDADLASLRADPRFETVKATVEANARRRFDAFTAAAAEAEPVVVLPPNVDATKPVTLVLALHGSGGNGKQMAGAWRGAARRAGAIVVAPDALRPGPGGRGYGWTFRDEAEWLVLRTLDHAKATWNVERVILAGYSQGANIAYMLGQSHADRFDAVVVVNGHYEADVAPAPTEGKRPRWYLLTGERDPARATNDAAKRAFEAAGMTVHVEEMPRTGHAFPRSARVLLAALEWCAKPE